MGKKPQLQALTGLRFFAALHVVFYHYFIVSMAIPRPLFHFIHYGYVGVSLFFVLSGFVLAYSYPALPSLATKTRFWLARFARIYPMYAVALLASLPTLFYYFPHVSSSGSLKLGAQIAVEAGLLHAWTPWSACGVNCPGWSLSAEAFFYLLFPFIIGSIYALSVRRAIMFTGLLWMLAIMVPAIYLLMRDRFTQHATLLQTLLPSIIYLPLFHLPQFLIGATVGSLFTKQKTTANTPSARRADAMLIAGIILGLVITLTVAELDYTVVNNGIFALLFAILLYLLADSASTIAKWLSSPLLVLLGEASYALYILQYPLAVWFSYARYRSWIPEFHDVSEVVAYIVCLILLSLLSHHFLEIPVKRWMLGWAEKRA